MTKPPSSAPMASVARVAPRPPSSSSSSSRSSWPSLSQRMRVGGVPARSARRRLRSRSIFSGGKKPNWRSARSSRSASRGKAREPRAPRLGALQDRIALGHVLAQPPGDLQVMLRLAPRAIHLVPVGARRLLDQEVSEGSSSSSVLRDGAAARPRTVASATSRAHRQAPSPRQLLQRALGGEIEAADRRDVVAPPLEPRRRPPCRTRRRPGCRLGC